MYVIESAVNTLNKAFVYCLTKKLTNLIYFFNKLHSIYVIKMYVLHRYLDDNNTLCMYNKTKS